MRTADIHELKSQLSEFLHLVAEGETVLVTDRGRVVAQLAPPPSVTPISLTEDDALRRLAAAGKIRLPSTQSRSGQGPIPGVPDEIDLDSILEDMRMGAGEE